MHEEENLDRILESSLSRYGDPGADSGLAERILARMSSEARVSSEQSSNRSAPRWRSRFVLWAALPAAACLLLTLFLLKSAGPGAHQQSTRSPQPSSTSSGSETPVANITPAQQSRPTARHHSQPRPTMAAALAAAPPKLDVFPLPQPLSPEERALYAFATQVPEKQRQAILDAQKNVDAPLNIASIHIQPLEISETGKN